TPPERFPEATDEALASGGFAPDVWRIAPGRGLALGVAADKRQMFGAAFFPADFLSEISQPSTFTTPYELALMQGGQRLVIDRLPRESALERRTSRLIRLGIGDLMLEMRVRSTPITSSLVIALMLPMLMWAAASGISWFVVDRLLVRPLRQLRTKMAALTPGMELDPGLLRALPAQEIRELASTFHALTRTVALHEAGLAEGLVRQKRLTREVHHRVKNNLQVISSLISLHARSAPTPEAIQAYASIQRRVDALAVVHRNHFAEMEENRGLGVRPVIGELASNIRASAPDGSRIGIALDVDPYFVSQDIAVAVAFLVTEGIELALACDPQAQIRISLKPADAPDRATLCIVSPALMESETLAARLSQRYGRVIEGLSRQLRAPMRYDGEEGSYAITIAVIGRE
ncbi:MAG: sensor histidine kinase, partial [Sphingomonas bacterium]